MRLPRLRVRTLMIAVLAIALAMGFAQVRRRWTDSQGRAAYHASHEENYRGTGHNCRLATVGLEERRRHALALGDTARAEAIAANAALMAGEAERQERRAAYHARLRRRYEYAASHPWTSVPPDPQPPE